MSASSGLGFLTLTGLGTEAAIATSGAQAKRVIFLNMNGGPSHVDTFDFKPGVDLKYTRCNARSRERPFNPQASPQGSVIPFSQHGDSQQWISSALPGIAKHADDLCVIRSMWTDQPEHEGAIQMLHTGSSSDPHPSLGAWIAHGLGSANQSLPAHIAINPPARWWMGKIYGNAYLPHGTQAAPVNTRNLPGHPVFDFADEHGKLKERYGIGRGRKQGRSASDDFAEQCLLACRLAEAGVRFIELSHGNWDQHGNHRKDTQANCAAIDQPIAALLQDLKDRSLLDETLVVWGGEFGRTPLTKMRDGSNHNPAGFSMWMAGGGAGGLSYGATNESGIQAIQKPTHIHDMQATIIRLLGLDPSALKYESHRFDEIIEGTPLPFVTA